MGCAGGRGMGIGDWDWVQSPIPNTSLEEVYYSL